MLKLVAVDGIVGDTPETRFRLQAQWAVERGQIAVIMAPSGSGKSTLLQWIAGVEKLPGGEVWLAGRRLDPLPLAQRKVGWLSQEPLLFESRTVQENALLAPAGRTKNMRKALERAGLAGKENQPVHSLSGGERQRLQWVRTWAASPELWLLDEPFSALDSSWRKVFIAWVKEDIQERQVPAVWVTHLEDEAQEVGDRRIQYRVETTGVRVFF